MIFVLGAGVDGGAVAGEAFEDLFGGFGPHEWLGVLVPCGDPGEDVGGEFFDVAVGGALQFLGGQGGEPAFDEVHPRPVGGREVEVEPGVAQQPAMDLWGSYGVWRLSRITCTSSSAGTSRLTLFKKATKSALVWVLRMSVITLPVAMFERGEEVAGAVALIVVGGPLGCGGQHRQRRGGAIESLDLWFLVDGEDRGGDRRAHVQADQVADLLHQVRVGRDLKLSVRHGLSPNARQISRTVVWLIPCLSASSRVDQCVASGGALSRVSTTTASITSSPMVRAAPGRGASTRPSRRSATKRLRHLPTVTGLQPSSAAISAWVESPPAQARTILDLHRQRLRRGVAARPALQRGAFLGAQVDLYGRTSTTGHDSPPMLADNTGPTRPRTKNSRSTKISWRINLPGHSRGGEVGRY